MYIKVEDKYFWTLGTSLEFFLNKGLNTPKVLGSGHSSLLDPNPLEIPLQVYKELMTLFDLTVCMLPLIRSWKLWIQLLRKEFNLKHL